MAFNPTPAQEAAINEKGNILVSAAAGSGKTAVLVERVIKKLCDDKNPIRADELLIVTFTNAAAAEMRTRIEKRIDQEVAANPQNTALFLQKHLLNNAKICTIDSFCIDLVRENFDKLGISPDFKIGEDATLNSINEEVVYSIIGRYLEEKNPLFLELLDIVGAEFDEKNFANLVLSIYEFSRQLPFPDEWFDSLLTNYSNGHFDAQNIWYCYSFEKANKIVYNMKSQIETALELISSIDQAQNAYSKTFLDALKQISLLEEKAQAGDWDEFYWALEDVSFMRLPTVRGLSEYREVASVKDVYKYLSTKALESLKKLFYNTSIFINSQFEKLYPAVELFIEILKEFENQVFSKYKENNIFTFHNTEHLALKLLCKDANTPTDFASEIFSQYKEVMVDEYQDTNDLQNMLFYVLSHFDKNLFAVGDVKQSIYAFRGANPNNFLTKKNSYLPLELARNDDAKKIILGNNFRSKDQICDFVNYFFKLFMQSQTGSIIYEDEDLLIPTAKFPDFDETAVNFDIIDTTLSDEKALTLEARRIAQYITETIEGKPCIKLDDNTLRKANYGDFTILLRSVANKAPLLVGELEKLGIPVNLNIDTFAQTTEITTFLSLLKVIDNPQNDIALLSVLNSPIFSFSLDELAEIRANKKTDNLYSAIIFAAANGNNHSADFLAKIKEFRQSCAILPLPKFISKLLIDTEFLNIASAMTDGATRRNNLLLLSEIAEQYNSTHSPSLKGFINYVSTQCDNITSSKSASSDAINIMSIHASKGLQFPICILASTATRFNDAEVRNSAAYSTKFGLGFKYFDESEKQKFTTISREAILEDIKQSALEEELRLLYVAMTRAQDKLLFVASINNFEKKLEAYKNLIVASNNAIDSTLFSRTKSYADWLIISALLHPNGRKFLNPDDKILSQDTNASLAINVIDATNLPCAIASQSEELINNESDYSFKLKENFDFVYPFKSLRNIQSKMSVSLLANKAESEKFSFTSKPSFMSKQGITATGYGTAMHKVMEFFDFANFRDVESEIERLYEWQYITEEEKNAISIEDLKSFFASEVFARIKNSKRVEREMRFMTEIPATQIDSSLDDTFVNEKIIVQGAVDVCFADEDGLVVLDFKTDRVEDINELAQCYGEQLSIYATACEKIFGLPVKEKIIYSFAKSSAIIF